jgi:hypothetical protein
MCSTARVPINTYSHQFLPLTRAAVSSDHTTGRASTVARIVVAARSSDSRARQHVADRTLADAQREDLVHQRGQPFLADRARIVQVDHLGSNRRTKRRTRFQLGQGDPGQSLTAAAITTAEQAHLRHVWLNGRQFDAFIDLLLGL